MDDATFDFYEDATVKRKEYDTISTLSTERANSGCDYGFDYESVVADSTRSNSIFSNQESILSLLCDQSQSVNPQKNKRKPRKDTPQIGMNYQNVQISNIPEDEVVYFGYEIARESAEEASSERLTPFPAGLTEADILSSSDREILKEADAILRNVKTNLNIRFQDLSSRLSDYNQACQQNSGQTLTENSHHTDDVDNLQNITSSSSTGDPQDTVKNEYLTESTNRSGVKYERLSECGRQPIDKWLADSKIGENSEPQNVQTITRPITTNKKPNAQQTGEPQNGKNQRNRTSVPVQVKSQAYYQNGELAVTVTSSDRRNPIGENVDVKITVIHKYSTNPSERKRTVCNKKKKGNKSLKPPADRNVVENRANWPEFNTTINEEAHKRYLSRHGI
ncbi:hypothetical protein SNE40_005857 [Patella caerulea]|uniref:Uncharacterized protein n=1 Tax=Patella caerulea TaxID=87958 RepID=A0AAN8KBC5_PATCE